MDSKKPGLRWLILVWCALSMAFITWNMIIYPARAIDAMEVLGMSQADLTATTSFASVSAIFVSLLYGRLLDTVGMRKIVMIFLPIGIALLAIRAFVTDVPLVLALTFLGTCGVSVCQIAGPKLIETWFPREDVGMAMGIQATCAGAGSAVVFILAPLFPSITDALLSCAWLYLILFVMWIFMGHAGPYRPAEKVKLPKGSMGKVLKNKYVWLLSISGGLATGAALLLNSYAVNAFVGKGLDPTEASLMASCMNFGLLFGGFLCSFALKKVQRFNVMLVITCVGGGICYLLGYFLPLGPQTWFFIIVGALILSGNIGLCSGRIPLIYMTGTMDPETVASAAGAQETIKGIFNFFFPMVVALIVGTDFNTVFILYAIVLVLTIFIGGWPIMPELGEKGKIFKEYEQKVGKQSIEATVQEEIVEEAASGQSGM